MSTDVTERHDAVEELRRDDQRKDEFLALLGHELRNPLAAIRNNLAALLRTTSHDSVVAALDVVDRQSRHMSRLINDLLDVTRIKRGKLHIERETIELNKCIRTAVEASRDVLDKQRLEFHLEMPGERLYVTADGERIIQIVDNLLRNAIAYTNPGGRIELQVQKTAKHAMFLVRDSGIGIEPDEIPSLFNPYYQLDDGKRTGGLGLGLTLVRELVAMHEGSIDVRSKGRGKGSTFEVTLPLARSAPQHVSLAKVRVPAPRRILVVDDQTDVANAFAAILRHLGQDTSVAYSGARALEVARERKPQVAFLDLSMPDMDGRDLARELRKSFSSEKLTLVALTGFAKGQVVQKDDAFDHYLLKPAEINNVIALLDSLRQQEFDRDEAG